MWGTRRAGAESEDGDEARGVQRREACTRVIWHHVYAWCQKRPAVRVVILVSWYHVAI